MRPVSARSSHEVSEEERRYENGDKASLLDIIEVPLARHEPLGHQVENHVLDDEYYWEKVGLAKWKDVIALCDPPDPSFWSVAEDTQHGINDKVSSCQAATITSSLKLVQIPELKVIVSSDPGYGGRPARRRVRGQFDYAGHTFRLSVTDPVTEDRFLKTGNGQYYLKESCLCVSLAEVWEENGYAFRLIASIITEGRCG